MLKKDVLLRIDFKIENKIVNTCDFFFLNLYLCYVAMCCVMVCLCNYDVL
jgi:hypothetical protein